MNAKIANTPRQVWMDIARGGGMILVAYGHCLRGLVQAHTLDPHSALGATDYALYTFHMPLFFWLSGLNVERSLEKGRTTFLTDKLWVVLYPYILWSLLVGSIQMLFARWINHPPTIHDLLTVLWHPLGPFWFLQTLFLCHLWMALARPGRAGLLLGTVGFGLANGLAYYWLGNTLIEWTLYGLFFYALGVLTVRWNGIDFLVENKIKLLLLFALGYALAEPWGRRMSAASAYSIWSTPAALSGIFLCAALAMLLAVWANRVRTGLAAIGQASMTIYVLHTLTGAGARVLLKSIGLQSPYLLILLITSISVGVPFVAHRILLSLDLLEMFGLAPRPKSKRILPYQWEEEEIADLIPSIQESERGRRPKARPVDVPLSDAWPTNHPLPADGPEHRAMGAAN